MERLQKDLILKDLKKKLVILSGPRQVGKTWLSNNISEQYPNSLYLNYDNTKDQITIKNQSWLDSTELIIFDEIHKMDNWKLYIKGVFDKKLPHQKILVTGSARLDAFNQTGESLAGRFYRHRLFPFTWTELSNNNSDVSYNDLFERGGFPEPLLAEDNQAAHRWRTQYVNGLIREDILDFERIHDLKKMKYLLLMLQDRVGSPISYESLARDLELHSATVKKYILILEALFIVFIVTPYSKSISRSILKEPKIYFYDTGLIESIGARFENMVGLNLLQECQWSTDYSGIEKELHYLRTKDQKEVDFAIIENGKLKQIFECKVTDDTLSKNLKYFSEKYSIPGIQLINCEKNEYKANNCEVRHAKKFFSDTNQTLSKKLLN